MVSKGGVMQAAVSCGDHRARILPRDIVIMRAAIYRIRDQMSITLSLPVAGRFVVFYPVVIDVETAS